MMQLVCDAAADAADVVVNDALRLGHYIKKLFYHLLSLKTQACFILLPAQTCIHQVHRFAIQFATFSNIINWNQREYVTRKPEHNN